MQNLLTDGFRIDGRRPHEIRQIKSRLTPFRQADGSAYLEQGGTKVLAAIYGPHEPENENSEGECKINVEYAKSSFAGIEHRKNRKNDQSSREMSERIKNTLYSAIVTSSYTRSVIDVYLTVLESDGSDWAACINAAGLALIDAGIVLKDMISACEVSITEYNEDDDLDELIFEHGSLEEDNHDGINEADTKETDTSENSQKQCQCLVDPNRDESNSYNIPKLSIAILPKLDKIIAIEVQGRLHLDRLKTGLEAGKKGAKEIAENFDRMVKLQLNQMNEMQN